MDSREALRFQNLAIENVTGDEASGEPALSRASIDFRCHRIIGKNEAMCVPIAVSEFSLADLIGRPRLLDQVEDDDGRIVFRYRLSGPLCPHRDSPDPLTSTSPNLIKV